MRIAIILTILLLVVAGCTTTQNQKDTGTDQNIDVVKKISGTQDLILDEQELSGLGLKANGCRTEDGYGNIVDSTEGQYTFCNYSLLNDTEILIIFQKYENKEALDGSYQYDSSHYYSLQSLISENDFGDQSRFRLNNENDYGGQFNEKGVYFYHLWFTKDLYLVHITSRGMREEVKEDITKMGRAILAKFG